MARLNRVVLDVLKPHTPDILSFARTLAERAAPGQVRITVGAVDAKTETVLIEVCAQDIDYQAIAATIAELGGSVHSIDEVEVHSSHPDADRPDKSK